MEMKDESPSEKEWRRWSTNFSSVPAFTHWERETVDWKSTGREEKTLDMPAEFSEAVKFEVAYHWTVRASMLLFDHNRVDNPFLLLLHHSGL